jgi:predicted nuclease of predicted toxin-antitoxin system
MRVLLDECLPRGLKKYLHEHDVKTVPEAGWAGMKNGELLRVASGNVDAFVTNDSNLAYQQTVTGLSFGVVVLVARSNRLGDLTPLVADILTALRSVGPGQVFASRWLATRCSGPGCARPLNAMIVGQTCGKDREMDAPRLEWPPMLGGRTRAPGASTSRACACARRGSSAALGGGRVADSDWPISAHNSPSLRNFCLTSRRSRGGRTPSFLVKRRLSMARL